MTFGPKNSLRSTLPLKDRLFSPIGNFKSIQYPSDTPVSSPDGEKNGSFSAAVFSYIHIFDKKVGVINVLSIVIVINKINNSLKFVYI